MADSSKAPSTYLWLPWARRNSETGQMRHFGSVKGFFAPLWDSTGLTIKISKSNLTFPFNQLLLTGTKGQKTSLSLVQPDMIVGPTWTSGALDCLCDFGESKVEPQLLGNDLKWKARILVALTYENHKLCTITFITLFHPFTSLTCSHKTSRNLDSPYPPKTLSKVSQKMQHLYSFIFSCSVFCIFKHIFLQNIWQASELLYIHMFYEQQQSSNARSVILNQTHFNTPLLPSSRTMVEKAALLKG